MRWRAQRCSCVALGAALVVLSACEAHGVVGSNVSVAAEGEAGGVTSDAPGGEDGPADSATYLGMFDPVEDRPVRRPGRRGDDASGTYLGLPSDGGDPDGEQRS